MSLLMDIQDYLRRYGTATQPELAQQFRTTFEMVEMVMKTLRTKGKVGSRRYCRLAQAVLARDHAHRRPSLTKESECRCVSMSGLASSPDVDSAPTCYSRSLSRVEGGV